MGNLKAALTAPKTRKIALIVALVCSITIPIGIKLLDMKDAPLAVEIIGAIFYLGGAFVGLIANIVIGAFLDAFYIVKSISKFFAGFGDIFIFPLNIIYNLLLYSLIFVAAFGVILLIVLYCPVIFAVIAFFRRRKNSHAQVEK